jgi:hypothetical protein
VRGLFRNHRGGGGLPRSTGPCGASARESGDLGASGHTFGVAHVVVFRTPDPDLPLDLLPDRWKLSEAGTLFWILHSGSAEAALEHVRGSPPEGPKGEYPGSGSSQRGAVSAAGVSR